jgi:hypothetical protein
MAVVLALAAVAILAALSAHSSQARRDNTAQPSSLVAAKESPRSESLLRKRLRLPLMLLQHGGASHSVPRLPWRR